MLAPGPTHARASRWGSQDGRKEPNMLFLAARRVDCAHREVVWRIKGSFRPKSKRLFQVYLKKKIKNYVWNFTAKLIHCLKKSTWIIKKKTENWGALTLEVFLLLITIVTVLFHVQTAAFNYWLCYNNWSNQEQNDRFQPAHVQSNHVRALKSIKINK